jgi:hypothetical protein
LWKNFTYSLFVYPSSKFNSKGKKT